MNRKFQYLNEPTLTAVTPPQSVQMACSYITHNIHNTTRSLQSTLIKKQYRIKYRHILDNIGLKCTIYIERERGCLSTRLYMGQKRHREKSLPKHHAFGIRTYIAASSFLRAVQAAEYNFHFVASGTLLTSASIIQMVHPTLPTNTCCTSPIRNIRQ